jgi:hypothetical protein
MPREWATASMRMDNVCTPTPLLIVCYPTPLSFGKRFGGVHERGEGDNGECCGERSGAFAIVLRGIDKAGWCGSTLPRHINTFLLMLRSLAS